MHPKIEYPGHLAAVINDLFQPEHPGLLRRESRRADPETEVSLAGGFRLDGSAFAGEPHLDTLLSDLRGFLQSAMGVHESASGYPIALERDVSLQEQHGNEAHRIAVERSQCKLVAADLAGMRRAAYYLQDEMLIRRAPILPLMSRTRSTSLGTRIIRCPIAPYRWLSGWELTDPNDYYPDEYLKQLAHYGINGLWVPGLLRHLVASNVLPELGPKEHRLDKLKRIVSRAARYGIGIYFFCMEPRALPENHPAATIHPQILGSRSVLGGLMCGCEPLVLDYIRDAMTSLFTEVPNLAGVIDIFCGERPTTCCWREEDAAECPRCSRRPQAEVLSETLKAFVDGIRAAGSDAQFMAWSYFVTKDRDTAPITPLLKVMQQTDKSVIWLGNFEHGCEKEVCGQKAVVHEYALACVGPSRDFGDMARDAIDSGRTIYAKLQVGTSYELSSVPHVPVPGIVLEKLRKARDLGVTGSMMTWIPGGFPSPMLRAAGQGSFETDQTDQDMLQRIAAIEWGEHVAPTVAKAWQIFADTWVEYPFDIQVLYWGPITRSPAYQLHLEREDRLAKPYNWGFTRKREPQPWEDRISRWTGAHPPEAIVESFRSMAKRWEEGLDLLRSAREQTLDERNLDRQLAVASAIRLHLLSAANVYEFYALRDALLESDASRHPAMLERMHQAANDDMALARDMIELIDIEPRLGFESEIYDFSYSRRLLEEKILQVQDLLPILTRWACDGIQKDVLERTVEDAEWLRPDRDPDRWGD